MSNRMMKDSGIEWIGEIPEIWEVNNTKFVFQSITEKNNPIKSNEVLSLLKDVGVIRYSDKGDIGNKCSEDITRYHVVRKNDIVMNSMNVIIGSVGKSDYDGVLSPVYHVLRIRNQGQNDVDYFDFLFKTREFQRSLRGYGNGILEHRMRIPISNLNKVKLPLPPLHEQQAIATYLDDQVSRLDRLIKDQQRVIEEWKAYKQSLITETVTKGLNPEVGMKDSDIEWMGEIPSHWGVKRLKFLCQCLDGKRTPISSEKRKTGNIPYWGAGSVTDFVSDYLFNEELILLGEDGAPFNDPFRDVAFYINEPIWANNHIHVLKVQSDLTPKYIKHSLNCVDYNRFIGGSILPKLTQSKMNQIELPIPPRHEQQAIAEFLDKKCSKIDQLIEDKQRLIEDLKDYKQSLIYECVTGKKEIV